MLNYLLLYSTISYYVVIYYIINCSTNTWGISLYLSYVIKWFSLIIPSCVNSPNMYNFFVYGYFIKFLSYVPKCWQRPLWQFPLHPIFPLSDQRLRVFSSWKYEYKPMDYSSVLILCSTLYTFYPLLTDDMVMVWSFLDLLV